MIENNRPNSTRNRLMQSKKIFITAVLLLIVVLLSVWLSGLGVHRSILKNALLSTTIISTACFLFFSFALYNGLKLKDNLGKVSDRFKWESLPACTDFGGGLDSNHSHDFGDGILGFIAAILFGIIAILFLLFLIWLLGNIFWAFGLFVIAALYWIFFRSVRFVLRHSPQCRGHFRRSLAYGLGYTALYSATFYVLILLPYFLNR